MQRTLLKLAIMMAAVVSVTGCVAGPQPMTVLMPTYSFHRDEMEPHPATTTVEANQVATAEP